MFKKGKGKEEKATSGSSSSQTQRKETHTSQQPSSSSDVYYHQGKDGIWKCDDKNREYRFKPDSGHVSYDPSKWDSGKPNKKGYYNAVFSENASNSSHRSNSKYDSQGNKPSGSVSDVHSSPNKDKKEVCSIS